MTRRLVAMAVLVACGPPASDKNPATLFLAPDQQETHVKLVDSDPPPY